MKTTLLAGVLLCGLAILPAQADYVTVHGTVGLLEMSLVTKTLEPVGTVKLWNRAMDLNVIVTPAAGRCLLSKVYVYLDTEPAPPLPELNDLLKLVPIPTLPDGSPLPLSPDGTVDSSKLDDATVDALMGLLYAEPDFGEWPYNAKYKTPTALPHTLNVPLSDLAGLQWGVWGEPWVQKRLVTVAVRVELKTLDKTPTTFSAWALNPNVPVDVQRTAWGESAFAPRYELQHPKRGTFVGPVHGLSYTTPTHAGITGVEAGGFSFYPGEDIVFSIGSAYIGSAKADVSVSPLDLFPSLETSDAAAANLARLLLSLDADGNAVGSIDLSASAAFVASAMSALGMASLDFNNTTQIDALIVKVIQLAGTAGVSLVNVPAADAVAWLENSGGTLNRRNVSKTKTPQYAVDKPKLDIMPVWVAARTASGVPTSIAYRREDGTVIETRDRAKPLFVTFTQQRDPHPTWGQRAASDIITAVSLDDGATWKRFNVSHMAWMSSFTLKATGEKFPGDCRSPQQKIVDDKILVVWTGAYARGGKPSFAIRTDDSYPYDDSYAVNDVWGVRGTQGSVNYNEDKFVADQGIGEIPYYALWACRGVLVWDGNATKYPGRAIGDIVWFKPERLTSGRRDAFIPVVGGNKGVGFAIAWQEDPGGLRPGNCMAGGEGWSGATVNKKTDIWYSFIRIADFELVDANWTPAEHTNDEHGDLGGDDHGLQPEISNRLKWLVPMSLPVRVSDNNTVNTDNLKVELDTATGLPVVDPATGTYIPLLGAEEQDYVRHEHEGCDDATLEATEELDEHDGETGSGGGWGMARYAYLLPQLGLADLSGSTTVWDGTVEGEYRPTPGVRWYRFVNQPGAVKTVAVTVDGRVLDGDTGACRPNLTLLPGGWAILGYEETKGLGTPSDAEHEEDLTVVTNGSDAEDDEAGEKGKDIVYHSFKFDSPEMVSGGNVVNLPALDDAGNLIPVYYKDAAGLPTEYVRQYATENARRVHFLAQSVSEMGPSRTPLVIIYKQGREGNGKPSDVFMIRAVVPLNDTGNPYRFGNLVRYDTGAQTADPIVMKGGRKHMNLTSATVEALDPLDIASDGQGHEWAKVARWSQNPGNIADESFSNPYSDAKGHRGFIRGDTVVLGYSFTPNWGRLGGDHMDFYVRRSFDGGRNWTTNPNSTQDTIHTVIERDPVTREYAMKQYRYAPGQAEPGRNVSLLKGNRFTVTDPRLVPPMGGGSTVNKTYPEDDTFNPNVYYVAFGTAEVIHGLGEPLGETDTIKADVFYTRTADGGTTWLQVPWVINPNSASPQVGETVYRFPWLAQGTPHQGHAQIRMHPSGTRLYAIWHQWTDGDDLHVSPHDVGNDIWFRRIDFMQP